METRQPLKNEVPWMSAFRANPDLAVKIQNRIQECFKIASQKTGVIVDRNKETVVFFNKSSVAGYVWSEKYGSSVFLNWELILDNESHYMDITIPHEVCHLFADAYHDSRGTCESIHGPVWKKFMRMAFNLLPERCHRMDTKSVRKCVKTYTYICACRKHETTQIRHNKMKRGQRYCCKYCNSSLVILNPEP